MASVAKNDELSSFDVPEASPSSSNPTLYKIILHVTPKDITQNTRQVCLFECISNENLELCVDQTTPFICHGEEMLHLTSLIQLNLRLKLLVLL
jgi:hypothetical protein